jgi:hypothetical protein
METVLLSGVAHFAEFRLPFVDTALRMREDSITRPFSAAYSVTTRHRDFWI